MYEYYRSCNEARDRITRREREAEAERTIRRARASRRRRRRAQLAAVRRLADLHRREGRLTGASLDEGR